VKCILNHTSWRCKADCVRRQLVFGPEEGVEMKQKQEMNYQILTHMIYGVSQEECARLRESVPYVKLYRYNPKHLCPK